MSGVEWNDHCNSHLRVSHVPPISHYSSDGEYDCLSFFDGTFHLAVAELPEFIAALYEAAGLPVPVILERPKGIPLTGGGLHQWVQVTPSPAMHPPDVPGVTLEVANGVRLLGDEPLRVAVALIDAMREAENEPVPAEVEELAAVLERSHTMLATTSQRDVARAVLRAGWKRQADA